MIVNLIFADSIFQCLYLTSVCSYIKMRNVKILPYLLLLFDVQFSLLLSLVSCPRNDVKSLITVLTTVKAFVKRQCACVIRPVL